MDEVSSAAGVGNLHQQRRGLSSIASYQKCRDHEENKSGRLVLIIKLGCRGTLPAQRTGLQIWGGVQVSLYLPGSCIILAFKAWAIRGGQKARRPVGLLRIKSNGLTACNNGLGGLNQRLGSGNGGVSVALSLG